MAKARKAKRTTKKAKAKKGKKAKKPTARLRKRAAKRPAKRATRAKRRTKPKARPRPAAKPKARPKRAATRKTRPAPRAASPRPAPAAFAETAAVDGGLRVRVDAALRLLGYDTSETAVLDVLTAIGAGYEQGPASAPAGLRLDVDGPVAEGLVDRYAKGDRAPFPVRAAHRHPIRATVDMNLELLGLGDITEADREVLTSFCLGSWNPDTDPIAMRDGIAGPVVAWYRAGLA